MRTAALLLLAACYHAAPATRDVALAWRGHTADELTDRWGAPARQEGDALVWSYSTERIELPSARIDVHPVAAVAHVDGPGISGTMVAAVPVPELTFRPGEILRTRHDAAALVQGGVVADMQGAALHWGPPNDANLHWGTILGGEVGMGRLANTPTPLPSGNFYLGGMIDPQLGLVGTYSFVAGSADAGSAIGMAAGFAAQYWPATRLWLRGGPAALLAWDPGFTNARFEPGVTVGASYAFVKVGTFALDLRLDAAAGPQTAFGTVGVGVNLN
jgi:hypothetical protein